MKLTKEQAGLRKAKAAVAKAEAQAQGSSTRVLAATTANRETKAKYKLARKAAKQAKKALKAAKTEHRVFQRALRDSLTRLGKAEKKATKVKAAPAT